MAARPAQDGSRSSSILGAGMMYSLSSATQRAIGILLLPLATRWMTTSEYGQVSFLAALSGLAAYLFPLGLEAVVMRGWFSGRGGDQRLAYAAQVQALLLVAPLAMVLPLAGLLALIGATTAVSLPLTIATLGTTAVFVTATVVPYSVLRAQRQASTYLRLGLVYVGLQVCLRVALVGVLDGGVLGWVAADAGSALFLLVAAPRAAGLSLRPRRVSPVAREALRSGLPLVPHGLGHWALALSDRLILVKAVTLTALGVYSVGYQVAGVLIMFYTEFNRAVSPEYAALGSSEAAQAQGVRRLVAAQAGTVVALGLAAALVVRAAIPVVLPPGYAEAADVVPWVTLGAVFVGLYQIPMNHLTLVLGQTRRIWFAAVSATAVNVGLNLLTVWRYGIMAAAVNTAVAYGVLLVLVRWYEIRRTGNPLRPDRSVLLRYASVLGLALVTGVAVSVFLRGIPGLVAALAVATVTVGLSLVLYRGAERGRPLPHPAP